MTGLFFAGYMVFQLPGGRLAEILGGKRVMTVAMGGVAVLRETLNTRTRINPLFNSILE